jgi:hypothetical protein
MWLQLDARGFEFRCPGQHVRRRWANVAEFATMTANYLSYVVYADGTQANWWELNRIWFFDRKAWLRDTYGLGAKNLADVMNAWRERALAQSSDEKPP